MSIHLLCNNITVYCLVEGPPRSANTRQHTPRGLTHVTDTGDTLLVFMQAIIGPHTGHMVSMCTALRGQGPTTTTHLHHCVVLSSTTKSRQSQPATTKTLLLQLLDA